MDLACCTATSGGGAANQYDTASNLTIINISAVFTVRIIINIWHYYLNIPNCRKVCLLFSVVTLILHLNSFLPIDAPFLKWKTLCTVSVSDLMTDILCCVVTVRNYIPYISVEVNSPPSIETLETQAVPQFWCIWWIKLVKNKFPGWQTQCFSQAKKTMQMQMINI